MVIANGKNNDDVYGSYLGGVAAQGYHSPTSGCKQRLWYTRGQFS